MQDIIVEYTTVMPAKYDELPGQGVLVYSRSASDCVLFASAVCSRQQCLLRRNMNSKCHSVCYSFKVRWIFSNSRPLVCSNWWCWRNMASEMIKQYQTILNQLESLLPNYLPLFPYVSYTNVPSCVAACWNVQCLNVHRELWMINSLIAVSYCSCQRMRYYGPIGGWGIETKRIEDPDCT